MAFIVDEVYGVFRPDTGTRCPKCLAEDGIRCDPGQWPHCWRCGVILVTLGRTPKAPCVTPNGRIDSHGDYVRTLPDGNMVCDFCRKPVTTEEHAKQLVPCGFDGCQLPKPRHAIMCESCKQDVHDDPDAYK